MNSCRSHKYIIKQFLCSLSENCENMYEIFWTESELLYSNAWDLCNQVNFSLSNKHCSTDFMISWWFTVSIDSSLERLHCLSLHFYNIPSPPSLFAGMGVSPPFLFWYINLCMRGYWLILHASTLKMGQHVSWNVTVFRAYCW